MKGSLVSVIVSVLLCQVLVATHAFSARLSKKWGTFDSGGRGGSGGGDGLGGGRVVVRRRRRTGKDCSMEEGKEGAGSSSSSPTELQASLLEEDAEIMIEEEEEEESLMLRSDEDFEEVDYDASALVDSSEDDEEEVVAEKVFVVAPSGAVSETRQQLATTKSKSTAVATELPPPATVRSSIKTLLGMTRPSNFVGVVTLHLLGVHLATLSRNVSGRDMSFVSILMHPSMCVVLVTLLLVSSTSMVVNDYYDNRLGVDSSKTTKPLVTGKLPMQVVKRFLSYLYAVSLVGVAFIPGVPARLSVLTGLMLTFWYTKHLKPITWLKNFICASLIALSPLTSGAAAVHLTLTGGKAIPMMNQGSLILETLQPLAPLLRFVAMLFFGFFGRELMMDINDTVDDRLHRIRTVPVKYGRRFASLMALTVTSLMAAFALWIPPVRINPHRMSLAITGCLFQLRRAVQVFVTEGGDRDVVDRAIEEGKMTFLLIVGSFV